MLRMLFLRGSFLPAFPSEEELGQVHMHKLGAEGVGVQMQEVGAISGPIDEEGGNQKTKGQGQGGG